MLSGYFIFVLYVVGVEVAVFLVLWASLELVNGLEALTRQRNLFLAFLAIDAQVWELRVCF